MSPGDCSTHSFGNTKLHVARSWKYYFQERARQESVVGAFIGYSFVARVMADEHLIVVLHLAY